jgi:hypothetical protein
MVRTAKGAKTAKAVKRAGRPKIGRRVQIILSPAHEAYAATQGKDMSDGVRACLDRCMRADMRKPIVFG